MRTVRMFSAQTYAVLRGKITSSSSNGVFTITLDNSGDIVQAQRHPKADATSSTLPGTAVFVSRGLASTPSRSAGYEIIATGYTGEEGKVKFLKYACVHPERPVSDITKLCSNCPRRPKT